MGGPAAAAAAAGTARDSHAAADSGRDPRAGSSGDARCGRRALVGSKGYRRRRAIHLRRRANREHCCADRAVAASAFAFAAASASSTSSRAHDAVDAP